jgi:hypothetical protein
VAEAGGADCAKNMALDITAMQTGQLQGQAKIDIDTMQSVQTLRIAFST